jgi:hypothetical protein
VQAELIQKLHEQTFFNDETALRLPGQFISKKQHLVNSNCSKQNGGSSLPHQILIT